MSKHIKGFVPEKVKVHCRKCGHFNTNSVRDVKYPYHVCVLCDHIFPARNTKVPKNVWLGVGVTTMQEMKLSHN